MSTSQDCCTRSLAIALILLVAGTGVARALVYGDDDRIEYYQGTPAQRGAADSVFVVADVSEVSCSGGTCTLLDIPYTDWFQPEGLCTDETYRTQPTFGFCTAFLVGSDLVATAGHCIDSSNCSSTVFIPKFQIESPGGEAPTTVPESDVYQCSSVVAQEYTSTNDYAVVQLDRVATPTFMPLSIRHTGDVETDPFVSGLYLMGYPTGLPLKIAGGPEPIGASGYSGATVKGSHTEYFESNLDAYLGAGVDDYGGNSGSPVFSLDVAGEYLYVEGILVRGETDYVYDSGQSCWRSKVCSDTDGCIPFDRSQWEEVQRSTTISAFVPYPCGDRRCDPGEDEFNCPDDCEGDLDGDGVEESLDNCRGMPNPLQLDADNDRAGDPCDCDETDPTIWGSPGEVRFVELSKDAGSGETVIEWFPPRNEGATLLYYDTLRSEFPDDFLGPATCVETRDAKDLQARDSDTPDPGFCYYYLIRAWNDCPDGEGPLGEYTGGTREGRYCP
jgi:hypothetical protein